MQPLLSIITINYNDASGLEKTIASVVNQTFKEFEYLIIDGNSTDSSIGVIRKYQDQIQYWISENDSGIYNAMNKGIKASKGQYLLFLNSGDVLSNDKALQEFILNSDFEGDIIYGDYKFEIGEKIYPDQLTPLFFIRTSLPHQSTFFNKKVFDEMGLYDERYRISADRAFYIKCFLSNKYSFKHITYPLSIFDLSGVSNDVVFNNKKQLEDDAVFREYYGLYYEDYLAMVSLEHQLNKAKRETLGGIWKRIVRKIKHVCHTR